MTSPRTGRAYLDAPSEQSGAVLALAHRGGARHPDLVGIENTIRAFEHAVALGYRYLETDVHLTRDGVLVAFHDTVLDRVTDGRGPIAALPWAAVRQLRVGGREPIPRLDDVLDAVPGLRFNIDLKAPGTPDALAAVVARRGLADRVLVGSFDHRRLVRFRRLTAGSVATAASPPEITTFLTGAPLLARRVARGFDALQVPRHALGGRVPVTTDRLVRRAHAAGVPVHVWTIDDAATMTALLDQGVDGLFTDRTDTLARVLQDRGRWWRETT